MDHYARLGVSSGATKDEIRDAYRAGLDALAAADAADKVTEEQRAANRTARAQLNVAWNVLSDPNQRARYDESVAAGEAEGPAVEVVAAAPVAATPTDARAVGGGPLSQRSRRKVIDLPAGMSLADTRPRLLGMVFDLTVIVVLVFVVQIAGQQFIPSQYPAETARVDRAREARTEASKALTRADDDVKQARADLARARGADAKAQAQDDLDRAEAAQQRAERADTAAAKDLSEAQGALQGPGTVILVAGSLLALLYLVPSTAITGRTLGMRLRQTAVVRADGSHVGWGGAIARFLVPVAITTSLFLSLPGLLLGFGSVLFWLWDPNRQGLHDRLARTLVVAAPVSKRP